MTIAVASRVAATILLVLIGLPSLLWTGGSRRHTNADRAATLSRDLMMGQHVRLRSGTALRRFCTEGDAEAVRRQDAKARHVE
jgi:hypothetical protein